MPVSLSTRLAAGAFAVGTLACAAVYYRSNIEKAAQDAFDCLASSRKFADCAVDLSSRACYAVEAALPYVRQAGETIVEYAPKIARGAVHFAGQASETIGEYAPKIAAGISSLYNDGPAQVGAFLEAAKPVAIQGAEYLGAALAGIGIGSALLKAKNWLFPKRAASQDVIVPLALPPELSALVGGRNIRLHFPQDGQGPWGMDEAGAELILERAGMLVQHMQEEPEMYQGQQNIVLTIERPRGKARAAGVFADGQLGRRPFKRNPLQMM